MSLMLKYAGKKLFHLVITYLKTKIKSRKAVIQILFDVMINTFSYIFINENVVTKLSKLSSKWRIKCQFDGLNGLMVVCGGGWFKLMTKTCISAYENYTACTPCTPYTLYTNYTPLSLFYENYTACYDTLSKFFS